MSDSKSLSVTTVLHLCSAHVMHKISYNIDKKFKVDAKLKRVVLHVFGRMLACKNIQEVDLLFEVLCYCLCFEKQTVLCQNKLLQLEARHVLCIITQLYSPFLFYVFLGLH